MLSNIKVIFENQDFLVIEKPAGLLVHAGLKEIPNDKKEQTKTLIDWLIKNYPQVATVGDGSTSLTASPLRPGIVHRLDKETSGVMVIAKTQEAFEILKNKFKNREIKKTYLALVLGKMNANQGEINLPIAKSKTSTKRTTKVRPGQKNSQAMTEWKLLKSLADSSDNPLSLLEIAPKTGRTHQIRVHLAAISHPVVGDYLYGRKATKSFRLDLPRMFLHAKSLEFEFKKTNYFFEAELSKDLTEFINRLKKVEEYE